MRYFFFLFLILCLQNNCYSQNRVMDSLLILLKTDKLDTNKLIHINKLSKQFKNMGLYDSVLLRSNLVISLSNKLLNNSKDSTVIYVIKKNKAFAYGLIGTINKNQGNYSEALKNHFISLKIRQAINDKMGVSDAYNNIGIVYEHQGIYSESLKNHYASLKIREAINDSFGLASSYGNIAIVFDEQKNYSESLKNHILSLEIRKHINDQKGISICYSNMGSVFYHLNNYTEALKNYIACMKIEEALGDKDGLAGSYLNIGLIDKCQGNYEAALKNYLIAFNKYNELDDKAGIAASYCNIATVLNIEKKHKEAEAYLLKSINLSKVIGYKENLKNSYGIYSELDSAIGNYKGAYLNHKLFILYRDSIDNEETRKSTIQSQMTYDFEKKEAVAEAEYKNELENQQILSEEKSRKQKLIIFSVGIGLILVVVFAGFIFSTLRVTRKQKNIIELQNLKTESQKHIIEEKHKEITDSINYAERIQRSFLATKEQLDEQLKDYFVLFQPKDVVSGDFYWTYTLHNGNFALVTADSTGHGVPGAIMSLLNTSSLEKAVELGINEPAEILNHTRQTIIQRLKKDGSAEGGKDGMDCSLICLNKGKTKLVYSAANNPIWIVRASTSSAANQLIELSPDKIPVGKHDRDSISFTQHEVELQKGDMIYTLTDGFPDQFGGPKGKKFMYKKLKEILISISNKPLKEQEEYLKSSLTDWMGNTEQVDDITIIGIRV